MGKKTKFPTPVYKNPLPSDHKYVPLHRGLWTYPAFSKLSSSAKNLYIALRFQERGDYGDTILTYKQAKEFTNLSDKTISKAFKELEEAGFIEQTKKGGLTRGGKNPSVYKFTSDYINIEKRREIENKTSLKKSSG